MVCAPDAVAEVIVGDTSDCPTPLLPRRLWWDTDTGAAPVEGPDPGKRAELSLCDSDPMLARSDVVAATAAAVAADLRPAPVLLMLLMLWVL